MSIPDAAANLVGKAREARAAVEKLRDAEREWTTLSGAIGEAESIAADAMRSAWLYLDRIERLADEALKETK